MQKNPIYNIDKKQIEGYEAQTLKCNVSYNYNNRVNKAVLHFINHSVKANDQTQRACFR